MTLPSDTRDADAVLRFSTILPDFADWLGRMATDSGAVARALDLTRHGYGRDPRQWVETARGHGSRPMMPVMIHGGYWRALTAEDHRFVLPALAGLGPLVGNLEYRLMPAARMADLVSDVAAGLRALLEIAGAELSLLPVGHSAGAHLAIAALLADPRLADRVAGVVSISGAFDLRLIARSFLQDELRLDPAEIAQFSVTEAPPVPTLFLAGSRETAPFRDQARTLAATRRDARSFQITPCHHMNILHATLTGSMPLFPVLSDWLAGQDVPQDLEVSIP
jgi:arylformamidase